MVNKYTEALGVLLNNGSQQILPVSKANLIELLADQKGKFGNAVDVAGALSYLVSDTTKIDALRSSLSGTVTADTGYVLTGVTESNGVVSSYTQEWLDASRISYSTGGTSATVQSAIEAIQTSVASLSGDGEGSVQDQITSAISDLAYSTAGTAKRAVTGVTQTDGVISATQDNIDAQYVDVANTGNKFKLGTDDPATTLTAQATFEQLQSEIDSLSEDAARYTVTKVTTGLDANVATRYQLTQTVNGTLTVVGENIDIPADSTLVEVYLGSEDDTVDVDAGTVTKNTVVDPQSMNFVHRLVSGKYSITKIDISKFFTQSERGDGLVKSGATLTVQIDSSGEDFLTVGENGVKLSGVNSAIDTKISTAIEGLDSKIDAKTENNFTYVLTGIEEVDGKLDPNKTSYAALSDENIKTTFVDTDAISKLVGTSTDVSDLKKAINAIADKVSDNGGNAINDIIVTDNSSYITVSGTKSGNTYTFTVDDSALGNVARLQYNELTTAEVITILGANPESGE